METKICTKCKEKKLIDEFYKKQDKKTYNCCKECWRKQVKERSKLPETKEKTRQWQRKYRKKNKDYIKKQQREYQEKNKERIKKQKQKHVSIPEVEQHLKQYRKEYYSRSEIKERAKEYREKNKENIKIYNKEYSKKYRAMPGKKDA